MPSNASWIDTALSYASRGYRVVPFHRVDASGACSCDNRHCPQPGDHPRFDLFTQEASCHEQDIRTWSDIWPESRVGALTGFSSNLVVLEVDQAKKGIESFQNLGVRPPKTCTAEQAGKKWRMFFQHPDAELPPKLEIAPGLTLYGDGGAVRLPAATSYRPRHKYRWKAQLPLDPQPLPLAFWEEETGIEIHRDWPRQEEAPQISLPFRHHKKEKLQQLARPAWMAYPWAAKGSLTLLVGGREAGKSSLLAGLTSSVLKGERFVGERCRQSGVIYLSEQAPSTLARSFLEQEPDEGALRQLSMLHAHDLRSRPWSEIVRGSVERAAKQGAEMIIIDSLDTFAAMSDPPCELTSAALLEPLYSALSHGLSLVCTASVGVGRNLNVAAQSLGPLGTAADVITFVSRRNGEGLALLRSLSKFEATPRKQLVNVDSKGCGPAEAHGPLFRNGRHQAPPGGDAASARPAPSEGPPDRPPAPWGDGGIGSVTANP